MFSDKNTHWLRFSSLFNQDNAEKTPSFDRLTKKCQQFNRYRMRNEKEEEKNMKTSKSNICYSLLAPLGFHGGCCELL